MRDRPGADLTAPGQHPGIAALNEAFDRTVAIDALRRRLREVDMTPAAAPEAGPIAEAEEGQLDDLAVAVRRVLAVDDFSADVIRAVFPGAPGGRRGRQPEDAAA